MLASWYLCKLKETLSWEVGDQGSRRTLWPFGKIRTEIMAFPTLYRISHQDPFSFFNSRLLSFVVFPPAKERKFLSPTISLSKQGRSREEKATVTNAEWLKSR